MLVSRVDVLDVADVGGHRHAGVGKRKCRGLRLPGFGQASRVTIPVAVRGQLHEQEGEIALVPVLSPVGDHGREELFVLLCPAGVRFTLIPDRPADAEGDDRVEHPVVEIRGLVGVLGIEGGRSFEDGLEVGFAQ